MTGDQSHALFISDDVRSVELIAEFLQKKGIPCEIVHHMPESDGVGLTPFATSGSTNHLEIQIHDAEKMEEAKALLASHAQELLETSKLVDITPAEVVVTCDECGQQGFFPGELAGTVQDCPHCGTYLDIPGGPDEYDWSIVDETVAEDDMPSEDEDESDAWG